jgi:hypothetical protein
LVSLRNLVRKQTGGGSPQRQLTNGMGVRKFHISGTFFPVSFVTAPATQKQLVAMAYSYNDNREPSKTAGRVAFTHNRRRASAFRPSSFLHLIELFTALRQKVPLNRAQIRSP